MIVAPALRWTRSATGREQVAPVRIGLIGCGRIAQLTHLAALTRLPGAELVAIAEVDEDRRAEAIRRAPRARAYVGYEDLLAAPALDAVVICLPPALHAPAAIAAFQAGKHVYLEKPLATSLEDGQATLAAWRASGRTGMIGFNYRFNPLHQAARREALTGRLGDLVAARSTFTSASRSLPAWKQSRRTGGGVLLDLASHHVDLAPFLFGSPIREAWARMTSRRSEDDTAMTHVRLANDLLVQSFFALGVADIDRFDVQGEAGSLALDRYAGLLTAFGLDGVTRWRSRSRSWPLAALARAPLLGRLAGAGWEPSYGVALARFVAAARGDQFVSPDLLDGYRALVAVDALERSARTGQIIALDQDTISGAREADTGNRTESQGEGARP